MVRKEIFGSVLATLLFSCSISANPLTKSYDAIEQRRYVCFEMAELGHEDFPQSNWLESLKEPKRTEVLQYLAMESFHKCLENEINGFKEELLKQSVDVQMFVEKYVPVEPFELNMPNDIDQVKLNELSSKIKRPFQLQKIKL